jgi:hypothetical protein
MIIRGKASEPATLVSVADLGVGLPAKAQQDEDFCDLCQRREFKSICEMRNRV